MEEWPGWVEMGGWLHTEMVIIRLPKVTHLSTNLARRRWTIN